MVQLTQHSTAAKQLAARGAHSYLACVWLGMTVRQRCATAANRILGGAVNRLAGVFAPGRINDPERRVLFT